MDNKDITEFNNKLEEELSKAQLFNKKIEEKKAELGVSTDEELLEKLPAKGRAVDEGKLALVNINGLALTEQGVVTRSKFFEALEMNKDLYGDIVLTTEQARALSAKMTHLSTGVNAVAPIVCTAHKCPFKDDCFYFLNDLAPLNKPCLVERDLIIYHTKRFIMEFDVHPDNHSELNLIQELAELIVMEMRATRMLAKNPEMYYEKITYDKQGNEIIEQVVHWAWSLKESIKNRRMKLLDALMATRKSRVIPVEEEDSDDKDILKYIKNKVREVNKSKIEEANYEVVNK